MSAFVWLDYSERERRKMLDVVDLSERSAVCAKRRPHGVEGSLTALTGPTFAGGVHVAA